MPITVAMIEEKEFKIKMRGYDPVEVDEFLDEIGDEMVALQEEIETLKQRLSQAAHAASAYPQAPAPAQVPGAVPPPVKMPEPVRETETEDREQETSEAAQKLLARAQKVFDETVAEAKEEAAAIVQSAKEEAANCIQALEEKKTALEKTVETLRAAALDYRDRFRRLIEDQQHILSAETELFDE